MPFRRGQPRPQNAGRKKGSVSRPVPVGNSIIFLSPKKANLVATVAARLTELGIDPVEGMAQIAADTTVDIGIRARMYAELAQYVWPKRRAIEQNVQISGTITLIDAILDGDDSGAA
jgi:hypothetical protein